MIGFELTSEQKMLQETAREFARNEIEPQAKHHDETGEYPKDIANKAWELGLVNSHVPTEYGGTGLAYLDSCIVAEEIAWGCTGVYTALEVNNLAATPVIVAGSEEQKKKFLTPLTEKFTPISYCVTEPSAGSDVSALKTTAKKVGNDYVLNGSKMWITNAGLAEWFFVLAYTDPDKGYGGLSGFFIPAGLDGIEIGKKEDNMGQRASDTRGITFTDVKVSSEYLLGSEGQGWQMAMTTFDRSRPTIAAGAVGLARRAMEYAQQYSIERKAFGKPIFQHQAVGFMVAEMGMNIEAARMLTYKAAWQIDNGRKNTLNAAYAKAFSTDAAMKVAIDAVQVYGGYGFSKEYPVEKLMRDAKVMQIYEGTSQIQRMIMVRELYRK